MVVDLRNGAIAHHLQLDGVVTELYDVAVLPGVRRPMALGLRNDDIRRCIVFPHAGDVHRHRLPAVSPSADPTRSSDGEARTGTA
jgi:hypothetical protein